MSALHVLSCLCLIASIVSCAFGFIGLLAVYAVRRELSRMGLLAVIAGAAGIPLGILNVTRFAP